MSLLRLDEAQRSPCESCAAPCCGSLPLHTFTISTYSELDYARYLLNFSGIELVLVQGQTWQVQLSRDCSRLKEGWCTLHGTEEKPRICRKYSAYSCRYKPIFFQDENIDFIRFNRERFETWASHLLFDEDRQIVGRPDLVDLLPTLAPFVLEEVLPLPVMGEKRVSKRLGFFDFQNSCRSCPAWCCKSLSFPFDGIYSRSNLDYLWFVLGFPGVEVGISDYGWTIVVHTRCRHFSPKETGFGCGLFGKPERPLHCQDYDETTCAYKSHYGLVQDVPNQLNVNLSGFASLAEMYGFTEAGEVMDAPTYSQILSHFRK